jgi:selenocysteine-specific elongation factor
VAGAGTVITGSTWTGTVAVGEAVRLLPLEREVRVRSIEVHGQAADRAVPGRRTALALVGVDKNELARGDVAVTGAGWRATAMLDAAVELLSTARKPIGSRTRLRVHLGTAEVLARVVQVRSIGPGEHGLARLVLETPLVARGGDRFVLRSFSPVTTIGGGVVLDPFPAPRPRLRQRRLAAEQPAIERLPVLVQEAGLAGLPTDSLPARLGVLPGQVPSLIAEAGQDLLNLGATVVARHVVTAEVTRLVDVLRRYHKEHPIDPGMSLQALRAAVGTPAPPAAVLDAVLEVGTRARQLEVSGSVARLAGWQPAFDARTSDLTESLARRLADARWEVPTLGELEREFPGAPIRAVLAHLAREGAAEQIDQERYAAPQALETFRTGLDAALAELGQATPAQLRERFGLTRKYLIPLLEWADRRGITRRAGDARVLARLTAGKGGP